MRMAVRISSVYGGSGRMIGGRLTALVLSALQKVGEAKVFM
jgi:hypothetical protein